MNAGRPAATPPPTAPPSASAAQPLLAPTAVVPPVTFQRGPDIRFKSGPSLEAKLVARNAEALALSPDAQSFAYLGGHVVKLVTPANPAGFEVRAGPATLASFSSDGSLLVVYDGTIIVLDVATGNRRLEVEGDASCALRFAPDNTLVFHGEAFAGNQWLAPVYRLSLASGSTPVAIGPKRFVRECLAAADGSSFITVFPTPYLLVDGRSGRSRVLPIDEKADVTLSPTADRYCVSTSRGGAVDLVCTRIADGGTELVITSSYMSIDFEISGRRAIVDHTLESPSGVVHELLLADFATATLRRIVGFEGKSGAMRKLMPGGHLIAQGSKLGQMVYDLDKGQKRFISIPRLYGAAPMLGHERRFFADAETPGGQDNAELYSVEVP